MRFEFRTGAWLGGILTLMILSGCGGGDAFTDCDGAGLCVARVEVSRYSGTLPLSPRSGFWTSAQGPRPVTVELGPQLITNPQWPNPSIKSVTISAARSESEIAIRLKWRDATRDLGQGGTHPYPDQAALLFPLDRSQDLPPITMGAEGEMVNIWIWKASRDPALTLPPGGAPASAAPGQAVEDLNAEGFSTLTRQAHQDVLGRGVRTEDGWEVVYKRALDNDDALDARFSGSTPMAVAIWDGGNRETNGQKGISGWIFLKFI